MKKKATSLILVLIALIIFAIGGCGTDSSASTGDDSTSTSIPVEAIEYVFESEWADNIEFLSGFDYSGTISGLDMIQKDYYKKGASNGYYVTGLYGEGLELEYKVFSEKDVNDAVFSVRISAEYMDIVLTSSTYRISVNDNDIAYKNIKLDNVPVSDRANLLEFKDYVLTTSLSLVKGENTIKFTTSNNNAMTGTMYATAPLLDCFKITSSSELTWNPCKANTNQQ